MEELHLIITSIREKEHRTFRFQAAMKGVNLDEGNEEIETGEQALERIKRRAELKLKGMTEAELDREEEKDNLASFGIRLEIEE